MKDARCGARGAVKRAVLPHVDGARVQPDRVARSHDLRVEVSNHNQKEIRCHWGSA